MRLNTAPLATIAVGMALAIAACGGAEPEPAPGPAPGPDPDPEPTPRIEVSPRSGTPATDITISAAGFEPGARIAIGVGPPQSEYEVFTHVAADATGRVRTTVNVPDWVEAGRDYLFVASPVGSDEKAISEPFRVTAGDTDEHPDEHVEVTGVLTDEGVECPVLRTDDDDLYTLTGEIGAYEPGDRVTIEGSITEVSICMQGTTIDVEKITGQAPGL